MTEVVSFAGRRHELKCKKCKADMCEPRGGETRMTLRCSNAAKCDEVVYIYALPYTIIWKSDIPHGITLGTYFNQLSSTYHQGQRARREHVEGAINAA